MGVISLPTAGAVYADTSAIIYLVERIEPYYSAAAPLWHELHRGTIEVMTSELTLLEVLVKPLRDGNGPLVDLFRRLLLATTGLTSLGIQRPILESAARVRAQYSLKTPDAIHAATALAAGTALFVTNDPGFRRVPGLSVSVLSEVAVS